MKKIFLLLLFVNFTAVNAQKAKKPVTTKKPATITKTFTVSAPVSKMPTASAEGIFVEFETTKGKIICELEYVKTPITVANFISLIEGKNPFITDEKLKNKPFYDGLKFHRVIKDFMIQGGDPAGNGSGGCGYNFKDEFLPELKFDKGGILAMANSGPATNSSQFFITHKETPWLNNKHTIFGHVTSGMDVVNAIVQDDKIIKVTINRKGAAAKKFDGPKIFGDYFTVKDIEAKKQAELAAEAKKISDLKIAPLKAEKLAFLSQTRETATKTASGLQYKITKVGTGKKPADGANVFIHYSGFLEDGTLFDSSYEEVNKVFGKFDQNRATQNGYQPFPFQYGKKDGLIPGFIEGLNNMSFGDKAVLYIPSNLGYGAQEAGAVIPPNSNIIFEVEMLEEMPKK